MVITYHKFPMPDFNINITKAKLAILGIFLGIIVLSQSQLTSTDAHEGPCHNPPTTRDRNTWTFVFSYTDIWYVPLASEFMVRKNAEVFLGHSAANPTHLAEMNWHANCNPSGCNSSGYGLNFYQACTPIESDVDNGAVITEYTCPTVPGLSNSHGWTKYSGRFPVLNPIPAPSISIIYTDLSNTLVFSLCVDGTDRGFTVYSKSPTLTSKQNDDVVAALNRSGYSSSYFHYLPQN